VEPSPANTKESAVGQQGCLPEGCVKEGSFLYLSWNLSFAFLPNKEPMMLKRPATAAVCLVAVLASTAPSLPAAFVTPQHQRTLQGSTSFVPSRSGVSPGAFYSSSTTLSMNLFDRFTRVAKANINNILKNLEDPEKIMTQAVEDMQVRVC